MRVELICEIATGEYARLAEPLIKELVQQLTDLTAQREKDQAKIVLLQKPQP